MPEELEVEVEDGAAQDQTGDPRTQEDLKQLWPALRVQEKGRDE